MCPNRKKTIGTGMKAIAKKANVLLAHGTPRLWYICMAKRGKPAAKKLRTMVLADMALFAYRKNTSTIYLIPWMRMANIAAPTGTPAMACGIHVM